MCLYTSTESKLYVNCFFFFFFHEQDENILKRLSMLHIETNNSLNICITGRNAVLVALCTDKG